MINDNHNNHNNCSNSGFDDDGDYDNDESISLLNTGNKHFILP